MGGALREKYEAWRTELKGCLAHTEAVIDFGDDEVELWRDVDRLVDELIGRTAITDPLESTRVHTQDE